jgi:hypothetical protein
MAEFSGSTETLRIAPREEDMVGFMAHMNTLGRAEIVTAFGRE